MVKFILVISCLLITACLPTSESAFRVRGDIQDQFGKPLEKCSLKVYLESIDRLIEQKEVGSRFLETIVIQPKIRNYILSVTCDDSEDRFVSDVFQLGSIEHYKQPVDLGIIKLQTNERSMGSDSID